MPSCRILYQNVADSATLTVANTAAGMGADKLKTDRKGEACRILANSGQIVATWPTVQTVGAVVIPACNLGPSSTIRVRAYSDAAGTTLLADTDVRWAAPGEIDANEDFTAPLNVNAFADGAALVAAYLPQHQAARRIVIDLADPMKTDPAEQFLDLSRLVIGGYFQPKYGPAYGAQVGTQDASSNSRAASGDLKTEWGPKSRMLTFDLQWIASVDRARTRQILAAGIGRWLFISLLPGNADVVKEQDFSIYGKPRQAGAMSYVTYGLHSTQFQIEGF